MGWSPEMRFRDCPWCGLKHAQMNPWGGPATVDKAAPGMGRTYTVLACPECAGVVVVETNHPNEAPGRVVSVYPPDGEAGASVPSDLPTDVARYYQGAVRVLRAGVPD